MNEARRFFKDCVKPAFDEWARRYHESEWHTRAVTLFVDAMAEWVFHHLSPTGFSEPKDFRAALAQKHPYFQIVVDVACGTKHVVLLRRSRVVTNADQISLGQYADIDAVPNIDAIANIDKLNAWFIELDDGSRVLLYEQVAKSIDMWERELVNMGA